MPTVTWSDGILHDVILLLAFSLKRKQGLTLVLAPVSGPVFCRAAGQVSFLADLDSGGGLLSFEGASVKLPA